jgi:hypothetical protein
MDSILLNGIDAFIGGARWVLPVAFKHWCRIH